MIAKFAFVIAVIGLISSAGFLLLGTVAAARFRLRAKRNATSTPEALPPVSLLKPLCGMEPNLEANLESFFRQDYPRFEIVFGTRNAQDPALGVVERLRARYPLVPVRLVFSGEPTHANAKVCSLVQMYKSASYDYFIISDSDVEVLPGYIEAVVRPLLQPQTGAVTCLYRGVPTGGLWSRLEALGMSIEMSAGVLVSDLLGGMSFTLGPTMATRRDVVERIGGFGILADYCADDYVLGNEIYKAGYRVELSEHVIDHIVVNRSFACSMQHQVRWMRSTRFSLPNGHLSSVLSMAMPFGVLGFLAALVMRRPAIGLLLFAAAALNRVVLALAVGWGVVRDRRSLYFSWLYPLRDFMGFCFWVASYTGDTIVWRKQPYRLLAGGLMARIGENRAIAEESNSSAVAVNDLP